MRSLNENFRYDDSLSGTLKVPYESEINFSQVQNKKNPKAGTLSDINYYFNKLQKFYNNYLTYDEIKETYKTVKKYHVAILSLIYTSNSFVSYLNELKGKFKLNNNSGDPQVTGSPYSREQFKLVTRMSRKAYDNNAEKNNELLRLNTLLRKLISLAGKKDTFINFFNLYQEIPFKNNSYADFIDYFSNRINFIETSISGSKKRKSINALEKYTKEKYLNLKNSCKYLDLLLDLEFENEYLYQKPITQLLAAVLKMKNQGTDQTLINCADNLADSKNYFNIKQSINIIKSYEDKVAELFKEFSSKYLLYVVSIANKFRYTKLALPDLIQEGNIGLLKAVKKYNHELGYKFITYAYWWIRQGISRAIANHSRIIRIPLHVHQEYSSIKKKIQDLTRKEAKIPSIKSLSRATKKSEKHIASLLKTFMVPISLDQEIKKGTNTPISSFQTDIKAKDPYDLLERNTLREEIHSLLNSLTDKEATLIKKRFGLKDGRVYTLAELSREYNVSRERIRQIEVQILYRLKIRGADRLRPYLSVNQQENITYC